MSNARNLANLLSPGASALAAAKVPAITAASITDPENLPGQDKLTLDGSSVATVTVNSAVSSSTTIAVDGVSGTIAVGMVVNVSDTTVRSISDASSETAISVDDTLTITAVASQTSFTVSEAVSIADNVVLILRADENSKMVLDASAASTDVGDEILFEDATSDVNTVLNSSGTAYTLSNTVAATSDGGAVTQNLVQGLVKSWISANFITQAYLDSFNQSSLTDISGGSFRFTVTNNFANVNYACGTEARYVDSNGINTMTQENTFTRTTTQYQAYCSNDGASVTGADTRHYQSLLAGDLA